MPFRSPSDEVVDAEVSEPAPRQVTSRPGVTYVDLSQRGGTAVEADGSYFSPLAEQRARAVTLFVRVPLLTLVALDSKVHGLIRLTAGALALWDVLQISQQSAELEQLVPQEWMDYAPGAP